MGHVHKHTFNLPSTFLSLLLIFLVISQPHPSSGGSRAGSDASTLAPPSCVPVQEIGIKARHELIGPSGQTAHYNAQKALPQGWKELNTCWLSRLSPCLLVLSPRLHSFFFFHSISFLFLIPLFFSPPFYSVIYSFAQSGILHLRLCLSVLICHIQSAILLIQTQT